MTHIPSWRTDPFRELEFPVDRDSDHFVFRRHFLMVDAVNRIIGDPFVARIEFRIPLAVGSEHAFIDSLRFRCGHGQIPDDTFRPLPWLTCSIDGQDGVWRPDRRWTEIADGISENPSVERQMDVLRLFCSAIGTELARRNIVPTNRRLEVGPGLEI